MKRTIPSFAIAAILAAQPHAYAVLGVGDIVSDPIAEEALIHKNIFDQLNTPGSKPNGRTSSQHCTTR
jgi:hypothetical protein